MATGRESRVTTSPTKAAVANNDQTDTTTDSMPDDVLPPMPSAPMQCMFVTQPTGEVGITVDEACTVTGIHPDSPVQCYLKLGDVITAVNREKFAAAAALRAHLRKHMPICAFAVSRSRTLCDLDATRRSTFDNPPAGFDNVLVVFEWHTRGPRKQGPRFGLYLKERAKHVWVSRFDPKSLASYGLLVDDVIVDVEGETITSRPRAKKLLTDSLQSRGEVSMIVQRADTKDAQREMDQWNDDTCAPPLAPWPLFKMPNDVAALCRTQLLRNRRDRPARPFKSALKSRRMRPELQTAPTARDIADMVHEYRRMTVEQRLPPPPPFRMLEEARMMAERNPLTGLPAYKAPTPAAASTRRTPLARQPAGSPRAKTDKAEADRGTERDRPQPQPVAQQQRRARTPNDKQAAVKRSGRGSGRARAGSGRGRRKRIELTITFMPEPSVVPIRSDVESDKWPQLKRLPRRFDGTSGTGK